MWNEGCFGFYMILYLSVTTAFAEINLAANSS